MMTMDQTFGFRLYSVDIQIFVILSEFIRYAYVRREQRTFWTKTKGRGRVEAGDYRCYFTGRPDLGV